MPRLINVDHNPEKHRYREISALGEGAFGSVVLVADDSSGEFLAKKTITDIIDILVGVRELDLLSFLSTKDMKGCVAGIKDYNVTTEDDKYIAELYLEYCSGGSIESWLKTESTAPDRPPVSILGGIEKRIRNMGKMVHTLAYLQKMGIYHLDVKTENFLMKKSSEGGDVVLCDFSNFFLSSAWKTNMDVPIGPQEASMYRPPEVAACKISWDTVPKADVWAMGVLLLEILGCSGNGGILDSLDFKVGGVVKKMMNLSERIKVCQGNFQKRNRRGSGNQTFEIPSRTIFRNIYPPDNDSFGSDFENVKSPENEMIWCLLFARELGKLDYETALSEAKYYFRLRNGREGSEGEMKLLEKMFRIVLPNMLRSSYHDRWTMERVSKEFSDMGIPNPFDEESVPIESRTRGEDGFWERIPDPLWREVALDFYERVRDIEISYGSKHIKYPVNHFVFTKHIAERTLEKMILGLEGSVPIPKIPEEREVFYEDLLGGATLLASEFLDFIFPYQRCGWFDRKGLERLAPFLELCVKLNVGELNFTSPSKGEMEVLRGELKL